MKTKWKFKVIEEPRYQECEQMLKMVQNSFGVNGESIYFLKIFADFGKIYTTYNDEIPICVIQTLKDWNDVTRVQIVSFAVHSNYQGKGVGTFTAKQMIKCLKLEGVKSAKQKGVRYRFWVCLRSLLQNGT